MNPCHKRTTGLPYLCFLGECGGYEVVSDTPE